MSAGGADQAWDVAWSAALDAMELAADEVERLLRHRDLPETAPPAATAFTPPPDLGPLPVALADRARRLMQRQLDLARELSTAIAGNRQQARLVSRLHREADTSVPVFVDKST